MNKSDQINELGASLAKAQKAMKVAGKTSENPFFKSKYAGLPEVWEACRDALTSNGLSFSQVPDFNDDGRVWLETVLLHSSGQWISGRYPVSPVKNDPQGIMSAITYARRGALAAMCGVVSDDASDDDGEAASGRPTSGPISADQAKAILDLIERVGADIEGFCKYMKVAAIVDIKATDYNRAIIALNSKTKKVAA